MGDSGTPGTTDSAPSTHGDTGEATTETLPGVDDPEPGAALFDESSVPTITLEIPESSMQALRNDPRTYAPATFIHDGVTLEPIGVRTKGNNSWQAIDDRPALKIKFDEYDEALRYLDISEITLNNMVSDYAMMHERVAYRVFREVGVAAGRAHHTWLVVNGEDFGLYTHAESATKDMIRPWYDTGGTLWEFAGGEFEDAYIDGFEQKFGEDDRTSLQHAADVLAGDGPFDVAAVEAVIDLDDFINYWAACAWTAHYDGFPYRYPGDDAYVYFDPDSQLLKFLPHGADESFYYNDWLPQDNVISRLGWKCQITDECRDRWEARVHEMAAELDVLDLSPWVQEIRDQIEPYVVADTNKAYSDDQVWWYQDFLADMVVNRTEELAGLVPE